MIAGVDLGASKISCCIFSKSGHLESRVRGRGFNVLSAGPEKSAEAVEKILQKTVSGGENFNLSILGVGAAGCGRKKQAEQLKSRLNQTELAREVHVLDDGRAAVLAAWPRGAGAVGLAGTGSIAYARSRQGEIFRSGGAGPLLGDEGGGCRMVLEAIGLALKIKHRRDEDAMLDWILDELELEDTEALFSLVYSHPLPRRELATAAPALLKRAKEGRQPEKSLVKEQVREFGFDIIAVLAKLKPSGRRAAISGGLSHSDYYTFLLGGFLEKHENVIEYEVSPDLNQCFGAALYAMKKSEQFSSREVGKFLGD